MDTEQPPIQQQARGSADTSARGRVLANFLAGERLKQIPARRKKLLVVLEWLALEFQLGDRYPEREVNARLARHHPDFAMLRRLLVDYGYLDRDHGVYWRNECAAAFPVHQVADQPTSTGGELEKTTPASQWYAMLFPTPEETARLMVELGELARLTGGATYPSVHVTVGYFIGEADPAVVVEFARRLDRPAVKIRASGLFSWSEEKDPVNGHTLSIRVDRDNDVREWQRRAIDALVSAGLTPTFPWENQNPHMMVLCDLPAAPAEVLARLGGREFPYEFRVARLVVSQRVGNVYITLLDQPLIDDD